LDLTACAATGVNDRLIYVSPKSGRAVSASAGEPYRDRLLRLPQFLTSARDQQVLREDVEAGFALTGYFLEQRVLAPKGEALPQSRSRILPYVDRS
jgi:DNA repair protein RecO (recombination protein O)